MPQTSEGEGGGGEGKREILGLFPPLFSHSAFQNLLPLLSSLTPNPHPAAFSLSASWWWWGGGEPKLSLPPDTCILYIH